MRTLRRQTRAMILKGLSARTQERYLYQVAQGAKHDPKPPDQINDAEWRAYFVYLKEDKRLAAGSRNQAWDGLRFFYEQTLKTPRASLRAIKIPQERTQPVILSRAEGQRILRCVPKPSYRVCLQTIDRCGPRISEGVGLPLGDIDSQRQQVPIRQGKGQKDRGVPLPTQTLEPLRHDWTLHRHPRWVFPARERYSAPQPIAISSGQNVFRAALKASGWRKRASVHTLRHAYAPHLAEAGISLALIQAYLGHPSLRTPLRDTHLTQLSQTRTLAVLNEIRAGPA